MVNPIIPVILCGGSGSRLWPMSRENFPKQLLPLASSRSLLQDTLARFADPGEFARPMIVTNEALRFSVADEASRVRADGVTIVLEPVARNTAPALAAAALLAAEQDPDAVLLAVPSDHLVADVPAFLDAVRQGAEAARREGRLVTFSIVPTRPETGYGYIRAAAPLPDHAGVRAVAAFVEKPDAEHAAAFLASGDYFWNSGMFLLPARSLIEELGRFAPALLDAVRAAVAVRKDDHDFLRLGAEAFATAPNISIDYAVMEHTARAATVPCSIGWTDVGAWSELWALGDKDEAGNMVLGDVISADTHGCYLRSEGPLVTALGVEDLVVVATSDAVLVIPRDRAQEVKQLVERLRRDKRGEVSDHDTVHRPWGYYQSIHAGDRFQVKRLSIKPGGRLSLQKHYHRAEHWVVVNGTALVTCGEETRLVSENQSIYIPIGTVHRLENPGRLPLNLIEVQSGPYLGEDDIVRLDDVYGRLKVGETSC